MEFAWEYIGTVAGASVVTALIVQLIKHIIGKDVNAWWLRLITWVIGTGLIVAANAVLYGLTWDSVGLYVINGVVVYMTTTGMYKTVSGAATAIKGQ